MSLELKGKIIKVLDLQTGQGQNGEWKKQEYLLETLDEKYPKQVVFAVWNDKIEQFNISDGKEITVSIEIESKEFNGKYYTNIQAWRVQ